MAVDVVRNWQPQWAVAPGEVLAESLEERGMSQVELARRTGRPLKTINEIVKGKASITADTAIQLELVLGVPARFWLNLERDYSESKARVRDHKRRARQADWVSRFPLATMRRQRLIPATRRKAELLEDVLRFFGVSSPDAWEQQQRAIAASFRRSTAFKVNAEAVAVWLRKGELKAASVETQPFDAARLEGLLPQIRQLSLSNASVFSVELPKLLATVGVVLVFTRDVPGTRVAGATRWLTHDRALIQLSLRHKRDDQFWFALFHELGHLLRGSRRRGYIDVNLEDKSADEILADEFASDHLIARDAYGRFVAQGDFSASAVARFAKDVSVSAGVVVGRLQHDGHIPFSHLYDMRQSIRWPDELSSR